MKVVEKLVKQMVVDNEFDYVDVAETGRISFEYRGRVFEVGKGLNPEGGNDLFIVIGGLVFYPSGASITSVYDSLCARRVNEYLEGLV